MLTLENITLKYDGTPPTTALQDISLDVAIHESIAIIGPSGSGKSSLLFVMAGLVKATSGNIFVHGEKMSGPRPDISLILQDFGLFPWKTVWENAVLGLLVRGAPKEEITTKVTPLLETLGLLAFKNYYPSQLSGGMRQRLAIARALSTGPELLLMDEPFSSLDALTRESLQNLMLEIYQKQKFTTVLVTHSIDEAAFLADRIIVFSPRPGKIKKVIINNAPKSPQARKSEAYFETCKILREALED